MKESSCIKVAITDDHPMVITGLQQMLQESPGISLCGSYLTGAQLLTGLAMQVPDVLLLDLQLPDLEGEELAEKVLRLHPGIRILVLSNIDITYRVKQMMQSGCMGYSLKNISKESLLNAIETVYAGTEYIDPSLKEELLQEMLHNKPRASSIPNVTRREKEILALLSGGHSSQQIADKLYLSIRTINNHRKSLLHKFNVNNTVALLNRATKTGVLK